MDAPVLRIQVCCSGAAKKSHHNADNLSRIREEGRMEDDAALNTILDSVSHQVRHWKLLLLCFAPI